VAINWIGKKWANRLIQQRPNRDQEAKKVGCEYALIDKVDEVLDTLQVAKDVADSLLKRRREELAHSRATALDTDL
jgi:hypothetical protein